MLPPEVNVAIPIKIHRCVRMSETRVQPTELSLAEIITTAHSLTANQAIASPPPTVRNLVTLIES